MGGAGDAFLGADNFLAVGCDEFHGWVGVGVDFLTAKWRRSEGRGEAGSHEIRKFSFVDSWFPARFRDQCAGVLFRVRRGW